MPTFGIIVKLVIYPECALNRHLPSYTPVRPLEGYVMATYHGIHALAVQSPSYFLNMEMLTVFEGTSDRIDPPFFIKLIRKAP